MYDPFLKNLVQPLSTQIGNHLSALRLQIKNVLICLSMRSKKRLNTIFYLGFHLLIHLLRWEIQLTVMLLTVKWVEAQSKEDSRSNANELAHLTESTYSVCN